MKNLDRESSYNLDFITETFNRILAVLHWDLELSIKIFFLWSERSILKPRSDRIHT